MRSDDDDYDARSLLESLSLAKIPEYARGYGHWACMVVRIAGIWSLMLLNVIWRVFDILERISKNMIRHNLLRSNRRFRRRSPRNRMPCNLPTVRHCMTSGRRAFRRSSYRSCGRTSPSQSHGQGVPIPSRCRKLSYSLISWCKIKTPEIDARYVRHASSSFLTIIWPSPVGYPCWSS